MLYFLFFLTGMFSSHDFHVSQCEIQYRPDASQVAVVMHIFIDDLELALNNRGHDSIYLCMEKERIDANKLISEYVADKFTLELDSRSVQFNFLGKEMSDDLMALWCYIEAVDIPPFESIVIRNGVLLDQFDDQKNIVSFEYMGYKKKHLLFDRKDPVQKIEIE